MSDAKKEEPSDAGCLLIIGAIIVGIAVGNIFSSAVGWLVIGLCLIFVAAIDIWARALRRSKS